MAIAFTEVTAENYIDKINNTESYMFLPLMDKTKSTINQNKMHTT